MSNQDRDLGMDSDITRRDFLDGVAKIIGGAAAASAAGPVSAALSLDSAAATPAIFDTDYPPMRQGMRGFDNAAR